MQRNLLLSRQREDNRTARHTEPGEADRPRASLASHLFDFEITLQAVGDRRVDLLHGEADETEPS